MIRVVRIDGEQADLVGVLQALGDLVDGLVWSLSDAEWWLRPDAPRSASATLEGAGEGQLVWLDADALRDLASMVTVANWGALLGFPTRPQADPQPTPWSEGKPPSIQHPDAVIEIQCVDGGAFEVYCRDAEPVQRLHAAFGLEDGDAAACLPIALTLLLAFAGTVYFGWTRSGPWAWLVEVQAGWFDGAYYPKATGGVVFVGLVLVAGLTVGTSIDLIRWLTRRA